MFTGAARMHGAGFSPGQFVENRGGTCGILKTELERGQTPVKKFLCLMLILTALTVGACAAWEDVPEDHWAADAIAEMEKEGIVNGFPDGTFHPNDTLTRAQFLAMVVRAAAPEKVPEQDPNHDWWWNNLDLAQSAHLLQNMYWEHNATYMDAAIPRQEAAELLYQANSWWLGLDLTTAPEGTDFRDLAGVLKAIREDIQSAAAQNLIAGYPDGTFRPGDSLTRAEGCTLVQRLLHQKSLLAEGEMQVVNTGDYLIKYRHTTDGGAVLTSVRKSDGQVVETLEVPMDYHGGDGWAWQPDAPDWLQIFGRSLTGTDTSRFWGLMGYYTYDEEGHFTQVTDRAVLNWTAHPSGDGILAISNHPGTRTVYAGGGIMHPAGNEVLWIHSDGKVETLLSNTPAHGLNLTDITGVEDGVVRVEHQFFMGMADLHSYEYAVENGKLRALVHEPGKGYSGYTEEEAKTEQARLDAAGCGVGSAG